MYLKVNDTNLYYQKLGKGRPLILLHGWKNDVSSFWNVVIVLKDFFTVYLVDLPGFGRSDLPAKAFDVADYADTIACFIKHNNLKKPHLLGHSVGGRIALKLSVNYPHLIDKLILEDSAGIRPKTTFSNIMLLASSKIFNYFFPNIFNIKSILRQRFYRAIKSDYLDARHLKESFQKIIAEDLTNILPKVKQETLLIWGEKDATKEASLKNGQLMYRLIPHSRLEVFENIGHFPHLEDPQRFVYFIKDFLTD